MIVIKDLKKAFGDHVVLPCVNMEIKEREAVSYTHLTLPTNSRV